MPVAINGTTGISGVDGSASTPAVQGSDTNTGVFYPAADTVAIATNGSEVLRANSSGNVGIGTTSPTQKLDVSGSINATGTVAMGSSFLRNRIINGAMLIDQRNAGGSVSFSNAVGYTLDRWAIDNTTDGTISVQQSSTAPAGYTKSCIITVTTADASLAATQRCRIRQPIEGLNVYDLGWGTANAQSVTLSFWVRSSLTGSFGGSIVNSAADRSYAFSYTISSANTWEQKTVTIPGDTTGTWLTDNGIGFNLQWGLGVGSSFSGTANTWTASQLMAPSGAVALISTLNATWYITGAQLEAGSVATPFERRLYGQELALCQRYYYKTYAQTTVPATAAQTGSITLQVPAAGTGQAQIAPRYPTMRASPVITLYDFAGTSGVVYRGANGATGSAANITTDSFQLVINAGASASEFGAHFVASAEL